MAFVKKYVPIVSILLVIVILIVALFYSIYEHIDGSGIFAIVMGMIFFAFILYKISKTPIAQNSNGINTEAINAQKMPYYLKILTNPLFIRLLPPLLTIILAYLEQHKNKLDKAATQEIQQIFSSLVKDKSAQEPTANTSDNKKPKNKSL